MEWRGADSGAFLPLMTGGAIHRSRCFFTLSMVCGRAAANPRPVTSMSHHRHVSFPCEARSHTLQEENEKESVETIMIRLSSRSKSITIHIASVPPSSPWPSSHSLRSDHSGALSSFVSAAPDVCDAGNLIVCWHWLFPVAAKCETLINIFIENEESKRATLSLTLSEFAPSDDRIRWVPSGRLP